MALVSNGFELTLTAKDNGNNSVTLRYALTAATYADAVTDTATIIAAFNAISDMHISGYRLSEVYIEDAFTFPGNAVQAENIATITGLISGESNKYWTMRVPAPEAGIFIASTGSGANIVDLTDATVLAYAALFQTGGEATCSDGEVLGTLTSGKRIHRGSTKG